MKQLQTIGSNDEIAICWTERKFTKLQLACVITVNSWQQLSFTIILLLGRFWYSLLLTKCMYGKWNISWNLEMLGFLNRFLSCFDINADLQCATKCLYSYILYGRRGYVLFNRHLRSLDSPFLFLPLYSNCVGIETTFKLNAPIFWKCHANATFRECVCVHQSDHGNGILFITQWIVSFYFRYSNAIPICCIHTFFFRFDRKWMDCHDLYRIFHAIESLANRSRKGRKNKQIKRNQRRNCKHLMSNQRNNCKLLHFSDPIIYKCMAFLVPMRSYAINPPIPLESIQNWPKCV